MGTWRFDISANDDYADFYGEIMDKYNSGTPIQVALDEVVRKFEEIYLNSKYTLHNLYFAAVHAGWECGFKDERLFNKVKEIINSGKDIDCWRELGVSEKDLREREEILKAFISKISVPSEYIRKPSCGMH